MKSTVDRQSVEVSYSSLLPRFLHADSNSFTDDPCTSRITRSYSRESTSFNSATATKSLRVLPGQPVSLKALAMLIG